MHSSVAKSGHALYLGQHSLDRHVLPHVHTPL
jgi:hypothetical protein